MIEVGQHFEFIAAAYIGTALALGAAIGWTWFDARRTRTRLEALDAAREREARP